MNIKISKEKTLDKDKYNKSSGSINTKFSTKGKKQK